MLDSVELFLIGFACVIDTVLLLVVCERINRAQVAHWLTLLIAGTWIVHASSFLHLMLREVNHSSGEWLDRVSMVMMAIGFVILPSAMLHGATRLNHTGLSPHPPRDFRYAVLYLPMLMVPVAALRLMHATGRDFLDLVSPVDQFYLIWILVANLLSIALFLRVRQHIPDLGAKAFLARLSAAIATTTFLAISYLLFIRATDWEVVVRLVTMLSPLIPAFLFMWHILRQRLLPLVIERTFLYGGILGILLLLHRVTISHWTSTLRERSNLDFVMIEWIFLFALVMLWRPWRERVRRALRYLLSSDVMHIQDATRQISVQLSQQMGRSNDELTQWFSEIVKTRLAVEFVKIDLFNSIIHGDKSRDAFEDDSRQADEDHANLRSLFDAVRQQANGFLSRDGVAESNISRAMESMNADLAFRVEFRSIQGIAIVGPRLRSDRLADEQLTALAMLCDQFAATIYNRESEMHRQRAERQSMQQEKLAVLGLIAGSLAHEIRNPLSSIRTIATLMKEDMPDNGQHVGDISMIVSEIDRLSQTTQKLLDFAKPSKICEQETNPDRVIEKLHHMLEHLARQHSVKLSCQLHCAGKSIGTNEATITEIAFNLMRNAVEAASEVPNGQVAIETSVRDDFWELKVSDNGKGIDPAMKEQIFQPFVTLKANGTGLGLFIVSERVRELSGVLECNSQLDLGTVFKVRLHLSKQFNEDTHCRR